MGSASPFSATCEIGSRFEKKACCRCLRTRVVSAAVLVWLMLIPGRATFAQNVMATSVAEADIACRNCHEKIYDRYRKTFMANGSGLAKDLVKPGEFHHTASGIDYSINVGQ